MCIRDSLSEDEIKKAVREAEQFANEDKERKEEAETRNHADSLVYSTEKTLKELGDKLSAEDKAKVEAEAKAVQDALKGNDMAAIEAASEKLTEVSYEVFGKIYQQTQQEAAANGGAGFDPNASNSSAQQGGDNVVDAEYEVVDDDNKK